MTKLIRHVGVLFLPAFLLVLNGCQTKEMQTNHGAKHVGVEEFASLMADNDAVILDVRTAQEFNSGHIPGARNIDVLSASFQSEIEVLDSNSTYLVYCRSGRRSQDACKKMDSSGFSELYELTPGFNGWKAADKPVE